MSESRIATDAVVQLVEEYVRSELSDYGKYTNRTAFDDSGVFSLHRVAAQIYAHGFNDGERIAMEKARHEARRQRDRQEKAANA